MTVTPAPSTTVITPSGTDVGPWSTGFKYEEAAEIRVSIETDGVAGPNLTLGSDYTVTGATPLVSGGAVTLMTGALPAGGWSETQHRLIISRFTVRRQSVALPDTEGFRPRAVEQALDRLTRMAQELSDSLARTIRGAVGDAGLIWPGPAQRAGKFLTFDEAGNPVTTIGPDDFEALTKEDRLGGVHRSRVRAAPGIDDTARLQAELDAGYDVIELPAGTIWLGHLVIPPRVKLRGQGRGRTILKRLATATVVGSFILGAGANSFALEDLTVHGNRENCSVPATNIVLQQGCWDFEVRRVETIEAKGVGGSFGGGLTVADTVDAYWSTASTVAECTSDGNDTYGLSAYRVQNFSFFRNKSAHCVNNAGINVDNFALPVPGFPTQLNVSVNENTVWGNGAGIAMFGLRSGTSALGDISSQEHHVSRSIQVSNNTIFGNSVHGLEVQADGVSCTGNTIYRNGSVTSNGGVLFNSRRSVFDGNNVYENWYYGGDFGGSRECVITNNIFSLNGNYDHPVFGKANQCIALNLGAIIGCQVQGNRFVNNGGDGTGGGCYNIFASRYDGANNANWLRWSGQDLTISDNKFDLTRVGQHAITLRNGFQDGVEIYNNTAFCYGVEPTLIFDFAAEGFGFIQYKNRVRYLDGTFAKTVSAASTLAVNDNDEFLNVENVATITNLFTQAQTQWSDKVRWIQVTNGGLYTVAPNVVFTGGGGTGAQGIACLGADGVMIGVYVTVPGTGYTSAPAISFTGGAGSGAVATAHIGAPNNYDRVVTLVFRDAATVTAAGNILLRTPFTASASGLSSLTLRGRFGNWYEVSREAA